MNNDEPEVMEIGLETLQQRKQREEQELEQIDVRMVMGTENGRRFVYRLLTKYAGIDHDSYAPLPSDAAFNAGVRSIGLILQAAVKEACWDDYLRMMCEARNRKG